MEKNIRTMIHEMIFQQYYMGRDRVHVIFEKSSMKEYIALKEIEHVQEQDGKIYLKELSNKMELEMHIISKIIGQLRDNGYVIWKHDGSGEQGTYVTMTELGKRFLEEQENLIGSYYEKVIEHFGIEDTKLLINMLKRLKSVMQEEMKGDHEWI